MLKQQWFIPMYLTEEVWGCKVPRICYDMKMKTKRILRPGQPGTKKLVREYGDRLLGVRYRYDSERKRRLTTVELILDETPWREDSNRIPNNKIVEVKIEYEEHHLRKIVKSAGGKWNPVKKTWQIPYGEVKQLGLIGRLVKQEKK